MWSFCTQCGDEEFEADVESVFEIVLLNPEFKGVLLNTGLSTAADAIQDAVKILHSDISVTKETSLYVSSEGCLIISLLQQWLIRYLTKRLMQLMKFEDVIIYKDEIPTSYLKNYLNFQEHFSLCTLMESYYDAVELTKM